MMNDAVSPTQMRVETRLASPRCEGSPQDAVRLQSCCLHVGLSKTATTTLQQFLFPHHREVLYLGLFINRRRLFRDRAVQRAVTTLRTGNATAAQVESFRAACAALRQTPAARGKVMVLSDEGMATGSPQRRRRRAEALRAVFGPSRVMITLRRPMELLESLYFQKLANEQVEGRGLFGKPIQYFTIEQWLESNWSRAEKGALASLDYAATIDAYAQVFGRQAIGVFLFEQLAQDPAAYYQSICKFIGIDAQQSAALALDKHANRRLPSQSIDRIRQIWQSGAQSLLFRYAPCALRRRMVGVDFAKPAPRYQQATAQVPDHWQRRIAEITRAGNRRLVQEYDLPLERYGYPV